MSERKIPSIAVDMILFYQDSNNIVLIERKNEPLGLALPGGFVDYGESTIDAVKREMTEELSLKDIFDVTQFHTYSDPKRDPRGHVISVVYSGRCYDKPIAADDAKNISIINIYDIHKMDLCFDHNTIINEYQTFLSEGERPYDV